MQHMLDLNLPHLSFEITKGLGHSNLYRDQTITKKVVHYLKGILEEQPVK
jgi:hypothetical protein